MNREEYRNAVKGLAKELFMKQVSYDRLTEEYRNAVDVYYIGEFELTEEVMKNSVYYTGYVETEKIKERVMSGHPEFKSFDEFHRRYMEMDDVPEYQSVWAIIIDPDTDEFIFDGWHRFNRYIEMGLKSIPCILNYR